MHINLDNYLEIHTNNRYEKDEIKSSLINYICAEITFSVLMNSDSDDVNLAVACEGAMDGCEEALNAYFHESGATGEYDSVREMEKVGILEYYANQYKITWSVEQ